MPIILGRKNCPDAATLLGHARVFAFAPAGRELNRSDLLSYYGLLRDYIKHEDGLINSRLTWSLTIHAFLLAAYGIVVGKAVDILLEMHKTEFTGSAPAAFLSTTIPALFFVAAIVGFVGFIVSYYSRQAIIAAHNAIQIMHTIADCGGLPCRPPHGDPSGTLWLPQPIGGGDDGTYTGVASAYYLQMPMYFVGLWVVLITVALGFTVWSGISLHP
jgi:hypothetical protein